MTLVEIFNRALESFDEVGWTQGVYQCRDGKRCAAGHIAHAAGSLRPFEPGSEDYLERASNIYTPDYEWAAEHFLVANGIDGPDVINIATWNDVDGRTSQEVRAALVKARDQALKLEAP